MAIVDSLSAPASGTTYSANANCHVFWVWTNENNKVVSTEFRYANPDSKVYVIARVDNADNQLLLAYHDGSYHLVVGVDDVFVSDIEYRVDIYANGTNIKVDVDDVEKINETVTYNATQTGGRITHGLSTNDIELESWPYGEPVSGTDIAVGNVGNSSIAAVTPVTIAAATAFTVANVGNSSIAGYNPNTVIGTGLWEVGAYIYNVIGEIHVNVGNVGDISIRGYTPALKADTTFTVGNVGGVSIASPDPTVTFTQDTIMGNVGAVVISGYAAVITAISSAIGGITRIAMKMATILRR